MDYSTFYMERVPKEESYNCDICCISMSSINQIQLVCRPDSGTELIQSLKIISNSVASSYTMEEPINVNGWNVYTLVYSLNCWGDGDSKGLTISRLLIGRVMFHLGKEHAWSFLVNGNIKGTADYLWFVRDQNHRSIYENPFSLDIRFHGAPTVPS